MAVRARRGFGNTPETQHKNQNFFFSTLGNELKWPSLLVRTLWNRFHIRINIFSVMLCHHPFLQKELKNEEIFH
jgi:hypothetical protein